MKITFPLRKLVTLEKDAGQLFVVLGRFGGCNGYSLMSFWDIPYTFNRYKDALAGAKNISKKMMEYEWLDPKAIVAKITL